MMDNYKKIPVHVITGFLGSGKTTLLNRLLKDEVCKDSAVIINEFGETSLDHLLVEESDDQIIELANGCICCTVRGQLIDTLESVVERKPKRIIIETTGLANPLPVLQAIIHAPAINELVEFVGLMCVVDAAQGQQMIAKYDEVKKQISLADLVVITKLDVVKKTIENLVNDIFTINPVVKILRKEELLLAPEQYLSNRNEYFIESPIEGHHHAHNVNVHSEKIKSITLKLSSAVKYSKIEMFLQLLLSAHRDHVLRIKGLVAIEGKELPLLVQSVGSILSEPEYLSAWPSNDHTTRIVIFLDGMDPEFVSRLFDGFTGVPQIDNPDDQALANSPLTVPGFKAL